MPTGPRELRITRLAAALTNKAHKRISSMNKAYTAGLITYANKKQRVGIIAIFT